MIQFRQQKYLQLRNEYPLLTYERIDYFIENQQLKIKYVFKTNEICYSPELSIPIKPFFAKQTSAEIEGNPLIESIVFHIGMIELISYWKATCSPNILIKPFSLNDEQIAWWKKIYFLGLGEFFYVNGIENGMEDFVTINCEGKPLPICQEYTFDEGVIVPIGGGKDSVVTLELLKAGKFETTPLILNPRAATLQTIEAAGIEREQLIEIQRKIDPVLLALNDKGYMNGHTPFSALLGFVSLLCAVLSGKRHIALSNESSANETTVINTEINHQYSKSIEFESDFRQYVSLYISKEINYFSFLRPLLEIQIAELFSKLPEYFSVFKSCNAGSKKDVWCGNCPKCLFTFIILSPFIPKKKMIEIYGSNLLNKDTLLPYFDELCGISEVKPFECVGTNEEVNVALQLLLQKTDQTELSFLLKYYQATYLHRQYSHYAVESLLKQFNTEHFLLPQFEILLKQAIQ
ncbi:MAG: hypothetical protein WCH34_00650 [Bacteroidota bacterium]